eukprot:1356899-Amorphochlora_amoeboformis.AAC.3
MVTATVRNDHDSLLHVQCILPQLNNVTYHYHSTHSETQLCGCGLWCLQSRQYYAILHMP